MHPLHKEAICPTCSSQQHAWQLLHGHCVHRALDEQAKERKQCCPSTTRESAVPKCQLPAGVRGGASRVEGAPQDEPHRQQPDGPAGRQGGALPVRRAHRLRAGGFPAHPGPAAAAARKLGAREGCDDGVPWNQRQLTVRAAISSRRDAAFSPLCPAGSWTCWAAFSHSCPAGRWRGPAATSCWAHNAQPYWRIVATLCMPLSFGSSGALSWLCSACKSAFCVLSLLLTAVTRAGLIGMLGSMALSKAVAVHACSPKACKPALCLLLKAERVETSELIGSIRYVRPALCELAASGVHC